MTDESHPPEKRMTENVAAGVVPPMSSISTAVTCAFGRGDGDFEMIESICALDDHGGVWRWREADPERPGSRSGWERLGPHTYLDGADPPPRKVQTR